MSDIVGYGGGKGGGEQHTHYEATDSLHSISYARVLDLISEGEILGLANGMKSAYLDGTAIQNADGTNNFKDVTVDFRTGTQSQDYIPGFPDVESEIAVGVELRSTAPWTHSISNLQLSAIRVTLGVPALSKADTSNGDILGYKIDYKIELSTDGGAYSTVLTNSFNGKTTTSYNRSARIDLPTATTGWTIRVTRLTANANTASVSDTTNIVSYTEVIDAKLRYPMSAIVGVQVDAKQFQSVPVRAYDMYGRIVQVPSNYDPVARTYAGVWDGTFKPAWTSNPAWIFRDLILNDRYGLGDRITASQVDKWALYKISQYCDVMVPNGKGGTEPRFTCNVYIQSQKAAYAVLQDLASVFRGISYWGGGTIMASADMPSDPVYVYTAANVIGGKFNRVGSSKKTRFTVALVSWNDPADFYKAKVEPVQDDEGIKRYGIQQVQITAFGCTSQGQAQRVGRWALATSRLETEAISFDVGLDGAIALPGQIVRIADPSRMGRRNGGRIKTASGRVVTLDKAPVINAGDNLTVILPSGVSQTLPVASVSGDSVTVNADWTTVPLAQSVWSVDSTDLTAPTYKILSITEKPGLAYTVTATQHEPGKYDLVESNVSIVPRPQTALNVTTQSPPAAVTVSAYTVSLQDVQKLAMSVSCAAVPGAVAYEGAYRRGNGNWIPIPRQPSPMLEVVDVLPDTYTAKIAAVNSIGVTSTETVSSDTVIGKNVNPKNAAIQITPPTATFPVNATGTPPSPSSFSFTASLVDLVGTITFTCTGGTLSSITATTATLAYADMTAATATITASITSNGTTFIATATVKKVALADYGYSGHIAATKNIVTSGTTAPGSPTDGDIWVDTNTPVTIKTRVAGAWVVGGNVPTALSQVDSAASSKLSGVATGATANIVSQGTLAARPTGANGDFYYGTDTLVLYQKVGGAWVNAANNYTNTNQLTDGAGLGTTANWPGVTGAGKPEDGANFIPLGKGNAINIDPYIEKPGVWALGAGVTIASGAGGGTPGAVCDKFFTATTTANANATDSSLYTIDPTKTYYLSANLYAASSNNRDMYVFVNFFNAAGAYLDTVANGNWGGGSSGYVFAGKPPVNAWTREGAQFGTGTTRGIPASARTCQIGVRFQDSSTGSGAVQQGAQDIRLEAVLTQAQIDASFQSTLNDKISKTAGGILSGPVSLTTGGAVQVGTAGWTGTSPTGTGVVISPKGIAGVNAGTATFTIDATTGAATFAGTISGASGTFAGSLTASQVITTDNIVNNGVSGVDVFSSIDNTGSSFVLTADSKTLVLATVVDEAGGAQGYSIDKFVSGTTWTNDVATYSTSGASTSNLYSLTAGTYRIRAHSSFANTVTNVTILKIKK